MELTSKYVVEISIREEVSQEYLSQIKEFYEGDTAFNMLNLRDNLECELRDRLGGVAKIKSQVITSDFGVLKWVEENGI